MVISTHESLSASAKHADAHSITMSWRNPGLSGSGGFDFNGGLWLGGLQSNPRSQVYNTTHDGISGLSHPVVLQHFHHEVKTTDWEHWFDFDVKKFSGVHIQLAATVGHYSSHGAYTSLHNLELGSTWPHNNSGESQVYACEPAESTASSTYILSNSPSNFSFGYSNSWSIGGSEPSSGDASSNPALALNASNSIARIFIKGVEAKDSIRGLMWFYTTDIRNFDP